MAEPSLTEVFGANATLSSTDISLKLSDLGITGENPRAEQIFAAIMIKAKNYLNTTQQTTNPDIQVTISRGIASITQRNGLAYREKQLTASFQSRDSESDEPDPSDY